MIVSMKSDKMAAYLNKWLRDNDRAARWIARRAGVSHTVVVDMTKGHVPKLDYIIAVEKAMGVEPSTLVDLASQVNRGGVDPRVASKFSSSWNRLPKELQEQTAEVFSHLSPDEWAIWLRSIIESKLALGVRVSGDDENARDEEPLAPETRKGAKRSKAQLQQTGKKA